VVVGIGVIVVTLLSMLLGGSSDDGKVSTRDEIRQAQGLEPGLTDTPKTKLGPSGSTKVGTPLKAGGADPFANASSDHTLHKVVIRFTSDGAMYAGWRYRTKGGEGSKIASRTLEVSKTVRGALPVAQAAVQSLQTSTYATCTIFVDGVAVTRQTARGVNHVTVCIG
jgi:hypothetical protein